MPFNDLEALQRVLAVFYRTVVAVVLREGK